MHDPHPELTRLYLAAVQAQDEAEIDRLSDELDALGNSYLAAREARLTARGALGRAAEFYASRGWAVFPLVAGQKIPATAHGFKDATTDLDRVRGWWSARPNSNIGLATGEVSGVDVIDLDGREGVRSWYGTPGDRPTLLGRVMTPRPGGWHLYVPSTGRGNRAGMRPGVDYRGTGGFVVLPPSWSEEHARRYSWVDVPEFLTEVRP